MLPSLSLFYECFFNRMLLFATLMYKKSIGTSMHPTRLLYSAMQRQCLVFFESYDLISTKSPETPPLQQELNSSKKDKEQKKAKYSHGLKSATALINSRLESTRSKAKQLKNNEDASKTQALDTQQRTRFRYWLSGDHYSPEAKNMPKQLFKGKRALSYYLLQLLRFLMSCMLNLTQGATGCLLAPIT